MCSFNSIKDAIHKATTLGLDLVQVSGQTSRQLDECIADSECGTITAK